MAKQSSILTEPEPRVSASLNWCAYHVFYHGQRNRALLQLVYPLVRELLSCEAIDRFFFIRYGLGGPHLRLRWRVPDQRAARVAEDRLAELASRFFASCASSSPMPEEQIRQMNRVLLGIETAVQSEEDRVYSDNSWGSFPVIFEQDRYGGPQRLPLSTELFNLSSIRVLRGLFDHGESTHAWVRPAMLRLASQLAWGFAEDEEDFISLAGYAERFMGPDFAPCVLEGDASFARRGAKIVDMLVGELQRLVAEDLQAGAHTLANGAHCVRRSLAGLSAQAQWNVAASHVHMTANRLGLNNAEEVYLSRILQRAAAELRQKAPAEWKQLWDRRAVFVDRAAGLSIEKMVADEWKRFIH